MKFFYFLVLCCYALIIEVCYAESTCEYVTGTTGNVFYQSHTRRIQNFNKCWYIQPPQESFVHLKFVQLSLNDPYCDNVYIDLSDYTGRQEKVCRRYPFVEWTNKTISMMGDINMTLSMRSTWDYVSFSMEYYTESMICATKNHFRCSSSQCIRSEQLCNGVEDCENGLDESECGIAAINGSKNSRTNAINWLMRHQKDFGWGRNTHRAVTSLYLTDAAKFRGKDVNEEIIVKQLQLRMAAALMKNSTEPMSVNELSMYVNSLLITCHDVRNIFSNDLLKILASRAFSSSAVSPGAYLTLCNANWQFSERNVHQLLDLLTKDIEYPFAMEIRAMSIMALSCINQKTPFVLSMYNASSDYDETVQDFMVHQKYDGNFGNAHTTAMVTQALIASGQAENSQWNASRAIQFLMRHLNSSSVDFLSVYLTLPLLRGNTLVDIGSTHCSGYQRKLEDDEDIIDVTDKLGAKIHIQYSLYIGDHKNVIHNLYLKVPENSTVYDVMKVAKIADPKYKFSYHKANHHVYIYELAGLTNDMEAGKYWLLNIASNDSTKLEHFTLSPDQIIINDKEHLIMWYKSANI